MNAVNRAASSIFDVVLTPFELLGVEVALLCVSGLTGILALILFKHISWQKGIKSVKDRIKGHMIAIRIYQNDLGIVFKSVFKVVLRNFQYLGLNFGPILPLLVPFVLVLAQLVVRYGFDPLPVIETEEEVAALLPGEGTLIEIEMKRGSEAAIRGLEVNLPEGIQARSPLVRSEVDGVAYLEVVARKPGAGEVEFLVDGRRVGTKEIVAGKDATRSMQPERVSGFWASWLWPAEDTFGRDSPLGRVAFDYPERDLRFLPGGPIGILVVFFVSSMAFGLLILKPLKIQI